MQDGFDGGNPQWPLPEGVRLVPAGAAAEVGLVIRSEGSRKLCRCTQQVLTCSTGPWVDDNVNRSATSAGAAQSGSGHTTIQSMSPPHAALAAPAEWIPVWCGSPVAADAR